MDADRFDRMSRAMGEAKTRRGLLAAFGSGIAAVAIGRFAQPAVAQVKLCTVDAECPENERCASGLCVGALTDAGPLPDWAVGEAVSVGTAQCCELCSRKIDGCTVACSKAPDRANCYTGCYTRYKNCVSACSGACR